MVLVDTSVLVEFFREKGDARVKLAVKGLFDEMEAALCGPVEMEFLGCRNGEGSDWPRNAMIGLRRAERIFAFFRDDAVTKDGQTGACQKRAGF